MNIFCIHPGWMRTNNDNLKEGDVFITYEGEKYPF